MGVKLLIILVNIKNYFTITRRFLTLLPVIIKPFLKRYHYGRVTAVIAQCESDVPGIGAALAGKDQAGLFKEGGLTLTGGGGRGADPVFEKGAG
jgi:hypothetical protein